MQHNVLLASSELVVCCPFDDKRRVMHGAGSLKVELSPLEAFSNFIRPDEVCATALGSQITGRTLGTGAARSTSMLQRSVCKAGSRHRDILQRMDESGTTASNATEHGEERRTLGTGAVRSRSTLQRSVWKAGSTDVKRSSTGLRPAAPAAAPPANSLRLACRIGQGNAKLQQRCGLQSEGALLELAEGCPQQTICVEKRRLRHDSHAHAGSLSGRWREKLREKAAAQDECGVTELAGGGVDVEQQAVVAQGTPSM